MGMTITNCCKLFCCSVKRYYYEELVFIRELLECLALDFFKNKFSTDTGNLANNIPPLDEVNDGETVSTFYEIHFSCCISPSASSSAIYDITLNSDSSMSIGYQHTAKRE